MTESRPTLARRVALLLGALVAAPVVYLLVRGLCVGRNIAIADDIDGVLILLLQLHDGASWSELWRRIFELSNEHRMATSRSLVTLSYWLTGTVNFAVFGAIGNLFLCGACALLVRTAGSAERKWSLALLLAALLFQLEHFENFFWSGASIDHFQIVLLATAAFVLLARRSAVAWWGALAFAALATFTLAHGLMVWPVGALVLLADRRWRSLAGWLLAGGAAAAGFLASFEFNPSHQIGDFSAAGVAQLFVYWLQLLGAPVALGNKVAAAFGGGILLAGLGWQLRRLGLARERIALPLALWAVGSLGLVALGRANLAGGLLGSRYAVLAALAWALVIFVALHARRDAARPYRMVFWAVPALVGFNLAADFAFAGEAREWLAQRDRAVADFVRFGRDGAGLATLHPRPDHATRVIRQAEKAGVFEMPRQAVEETFADIHTGARSAGAIDRIAADENLVTIDGWAALVGREAIPGEVRLVLRSADSQHVLTTSPVSRPDVAAAYPREQWRDAGFHFELRRWLLPPESYQIGYLIPTGHGAELVMTPQRIELASETYTLERDKIDASRAVYDELLVRNPVETVTAAANKFTRVSFFDEFGVLVHVDFKGAGTMTVALTRTQKALAPREHGRPVALLRGQAAIAVRDADHTTQLSIYAARWRPPLSDGAAWDVKNDTAHIASISIASRDGKFGAIRAGNVTFIARDGIAGIHAPGVVFTGPVYVGNIRALASALPELRLGAVRDARITGGDLFQPNGRAVSVSGITRLKFVDGRTAHGVPLPARDNRAVLERDGRDVSAELTGGPPAWQNQRQARMGE